MKILIKMQFDPEIAKLVGVDCAIMHSNIEYWCAKNEANNKHFYDGHYWTYNSQDAFVKLFSFWSRRQIQRILSKLEKSGLIASGNYNKIKYDKTKWYYSIAPNGAIGRTEEFNGLNHTVRPIPNNKPNNKHKSFFSDEKGDKKSSSLDGLKISPHSASPQKAQNLTSSELKTENEPELPKEEKNQSNVNSATNNDTPDNISYDDQTSFEEINKMILDPKKHIKVIGLFIKANKIKLENKDHRNSLIKRYVKSASILNPYTTFKVIATMDWLIKNANFKWTIETIAKYIDYTPEQLKQFQGFKKQNSTPKVFGEDIKA